MNSVRSKAKVRKRHSTAKEKGKVFVSLDQVLSHFFQEGSARRRPTKGKEQGAAVAEQAFSKIEESLEGIA